MTLYLHCWHVTLCRQNITFLFVKQISQVALNNSMKESEEIQVVYSQEKQAPKRQGLPYILTSKKQSQPQSSELPPSFQQIMLLPRENPASWKCFQIFRIQRVPTIHRKGCTKINRIPQTGATCVRLSQCFLHPLPSRWDPTSLNSPGRKEILKIMCYLKEILKGN